MVGVVAQRLHGGRQGREDAALGRGGGRAGGVRHGKLYYAASRGDCKQLAIGAHGEMGDGVAGGGGVGVYRRHGELGDALLAGHVPHARLAILAAGCQEDTFEEADAVGAALVPREDALDGAGVSVEHRDLGVAGAHGQDLALGGERHAGHRFRGLERPDGLALVHADVGVFQAQSAVWVVVMGWLIIRCGVLVGHGAAGVYGTCGFFGQRSILNNAYGVAGGTRTRQFFLFLLCGKPTGLLV